MSDYIVVAGDNLSRIAARHGIRYWQNIYLATAKIKNRVRSCYLPLFYASLCKWRDP